MGPLAQLVEQLTLNQRVVGSIPTRPTIFFNVSVPKQPEQIKKSYSMDVISKNAEELLQDSILTEIVQRLTSTFHPEYIYLFGSIARGQAGPDSDYDLLMVLRDSSLPRYRRDQEAFRVLTGVGASKDILVLTMKEFESQRKAPSSLPATVEREGILLYAA